MNPSNSLVIKTHNLSKASLFILLSLSPSCASSDRSFNKKVMI